MTENKPLATLIDDAQAERAATRRPPLVIYHSPCLDGFTAAWAMWLAFPDAEFAPGVYGQAPPDCAGRDVYLLDFSYKLPVMKEIAGICKSLTVLDHHKTAEADLAAFTGSDNGGLVNTVFDMAKSGARLAWEWFHPGTPVPLMVQLVEDHDLWRFALPNTRELTAAYFSHEYGFARWNQLSADTEDAAAYLVLAAEGRAIERKHHKDVAELVAKLRHVRHFYRTMIKVTETVETYDVPCANLPYTYASDAAGLMAEGAPFAATYFQDADGWYVFSLRSRGEGGVDVSEVATHYGGGGHKNAAGFRVKSLEEL